MDRVHEDRKNQERRERGQRAAPFLQDAEGHGRREEQIGRTDRHGQAEGQARERRRPRLLFEQKPERERQEEERRPVLEEALARDAPDLRAGGVEEREPESFELRAADAPQREEEKEDGERGEHRRRHQGEAKSMLVERHAGRLRGGEDGDVEEPRQDRIVRDDPTVPDAEPVRQRLSRPDERVKVERAVLEDGDREKFRRHRVPAPDVAAAPEVERKGHEKRRCRQDCRPSRPGQRRRMEHGAKL